MKVLSRKDAELITELAKNGITVTEVAKHAIKAMLQEADKDEYTKYVYEKTVETLKKTYEGKI